MKNLIKGLNNKRFNEAIDDLVSIYNDLKEEKNHAIEQLNNYNKDEEIQKLTKEIQKLKEKNTNCVEFLITPEENKEINKWIDKHVKEKHNNNHYAGTIGGRFTYQFTSTSIGEVGEIVCSCGEEFCFRDLY